jgi:hypothetical protein
VIFRNTPQWFIAMDRPIAPPLSSLQRGEGRGEGQTTPTASGSHGSRPARPGRRRT